MSITKLSPNWACQMGPIHCPKFLLPGLRKLACFIGLYASSFVGNILLTSQLNQDPASLNSSSVWLVSEHYLTKCYFKLDTVVCQSLRHIPQTQIRVSTVWEHL